MKRQQRRCVFLALVVMLAFTTGRGQAQSDTSVDYVSSFEHFPTSHAPENGNFGRIEVTFGSGPNRTGAIACMGSIFSEGATSPASDSRYLYSEAQMILLAQLLMDSAVHAKEVRWFKPGFPICLWYRIVRTSRRALISGAPT